MTEPAIMTLQEVAELLRVHQSTVHHLVRAGKIPAFTVGRIWRFRRSEVERWIDKQHPYDFNDHD